MFILSSNTYAANWDKIIVAFETDDTVKINKKYTIAISGVYAFVGDKKRQVLVLKYDGNTWNHMQTLKPTTKKRTGFGRKITVWQDVVIIEAPREGKNGAMYAYRLVNNRWRRIQKRMYPARRVMLQPSKPILYCEAAFRT